MLTHRNSGLKLLSINCQTFNSTRDLILSPILSPLLDLSHVDTIENNHEVHTEKHLVRQLTTFDSNKNLRSSLKIVEEAKTLLCRRINHQNFAEEAIINRKKPFSSRSPISTPSLLTLSKSAFTSTEKHSEMKLKELSSYSKLYEEDLENAYQAFKIQLKETNEKREDLRAKISGLREELKENYEELKACKKAAEELNRNKVKIKSQGEAARYFCRKASMRGDLFKREARYIEISEELVVEIANDSKCVEKMDQQCSLLRKEINVIREAQIKHFFEVLMEGLDTRGEGLQWVVKTLWGLKQHVNIHNFPSFLDEKGINCILKLSKKNQELEETLDKFSDGSSERLNNLDSKKTKWNGIHLRLAQASKKVRAKELRPLDSPGKNSMCLESPTKKKNIFFDLGVALDIKVSAIKNEIKTIKEEEIQRIFRECFVNGYEAKKKTSLRTLISAFVGLDNIDKYNTLMIKLKRNLSEQLLATKTFKFASHAN